VCAPLLECKLCAPAALVQCEVCAPPVVSCAPGTCGATCLQCSEGKSCNDAGVCACPPGTYGETCGDTCSLQQCSEEGK